MAATPFTTTQTLAVASASITTNPAATTTQIASIVLHNTNTAAESVILNLVPNNAGSSGASSVTNRILNVNLAANETLEVAFKFPLTLSNTNDAMFGQTTTAAKVVAVVSGVRNV